ncbi:hypothetical protein ABCS02_34330 [Microbacterium sp. X-17]|uniref:hypothetical protein n=1 Tax=Microbacterium sp. X-17 TaxID=3144404 RepID=UPI0031F4A903
MKVTERLFYALWLGLTVYLFQVAEPRPLGWYVLGPIAIAVIFFVAQTFWERRRQRRQNDLNTPQDPDSKSR